MSEDPLLGSQYRKAQPKLRMFANGRQEVNSIRADFSPAIRVDVNVAKLTQPPSLCMQSLAAGRISSPKGMRESPADTDVSVFIEYSVDGKNADTSAVALSNLVKFGTLATASVPLNHVRQVLDSESVVRVELGETLKKPNPVVTAESVRPPSTRLRRFGRGGGKNVLIGIIDVQGFDFAHPDFLDSEGQTRFERIWDQGGDNRPHPVQPGLNYGSEIRKEHMDHAISETSTFGIAPQELEPQSQTAPGSHATHVASIAAGNRGVCRNAFLAGVLISLPEEDLDRRQSFYDSTRIAHAVSYLFDLADELKDEHDLDELPVSINISLGTNGHAHDGSAAVSRWIDFALTSPGRSVCVAAGNAGQEEPEFEGDLGYVMGRIHTSGRIAARALDVDLEWLVIGNGRIDFSENELEIWYGPADRFEVSLKPPGGDWIGPVELGEFIQNKQLPDETFVSIYHELYHHANGSNYISIYLSPFFSETGVQGLKSGQWTVRLHGQEVRDGRYHGWIERDDPRRIGPIGNAEGWRFPSFFSAASNVDDSSVSSLGCGNNVICVANLDEGRERINISSSQGPTRDERNKPDVCAPGTDIVAANGFTFDGDNQWIAMTGTSMASPFVTGVVGLMLQENPGLTAAQIRGIIQRTARPLPGTEFEWRNDAGYGAIDPAACLAEVERISQRRELS